jgi:NAD+ kinase
MTITRVSLVVHDGKTQAGEVLREIKDYLDSNGVTQAEEKPDLVVSLGGDGTMLRAAQVAHAADAPLLGINLGTLGYLTEIDREDAIPALKKVLAGDYTLEERMMLDCTVMTGTTQVRHVGLNEVLVERAARHRLVRLSVTIGGESLAAFNSDGIIVATPTGSTAYALSAGGPIVSPRASCIIVVPVSAHMIFSRPFVLADDETVEIKLEGTDVKAEVT